MDEIPSCAAGVPIFRMLPTPMLSELSKTMRHRRFAKGELVVSAGDPVADMIVVATGRFKLVHATTSGREQVVRVLEQGAFLGELALFAPAQHEGDLIAMEESAACLVPRQAMQAILQAHPAMAIQVVEALAQRLAETEKMVADLGLRDVGARLAAELVRLAASQGSEGADGLHLRMPIPWSELALRLGTTAESLSRRLKSLAAQGIIRQESGRNIVICDLDGLRTLAEG